MKIATLLSHAEHPQSGRIIASPMDLKACSLAKRLQQESTSDATTSFIHFGEQNTALEDYLGYGLEQIDCYPASENFDPLNTTNILAEYDIIITGKRTMGGFSSGLFAYQLAEALQRPLHANIVTINRNQEQIQLNQYLPSGYRRNITLQTPAIIVTHESAESTLRFNYNAQNQGNIQLHNKPDLISGNDQWQQWNTRPVQQQRTRLKIDSNLAKLSADERMRQAVSSGTQKAGSIHRGSAEEAAQSIWRVLKKNKLVEEK